MQYHVAPKVATKFSKVSTFVRCARVLFRKETAPQFHVSNYGLSSFITNLSYIQHFFAETFLTKGGFDI